jgi:hypothetical protein
VFFAAFGTGIGIGCLQCHTLTKRGRMPLRAQSAEGKFRMG